MIFSIGDKFYLFNYEEGKIVISKLNFKTKKLITIYKLACYTYHTSINYSNNYVVISAYQYESQLCDNYVFNGKIKKMYKGFSNYIVDQFKYINGKYLVCSFGSRIIVVNDIETGKPIIIKTVPHIDVVQSPNGDQILLRCYSVILKGVFIVPTNIFLQCMLAGKFHSNTKIDDEILKYKIRIGGKKKWIWITDNFLGYVVQRIMCIYNTKNKKMTDIPYYPRYNYSELYFVFGSFYLFSLEDIMIINCSGIKYIQNPHKITHYNPNFNLFVNCAYEVYIQSQVGEFVRFKFIGDFEQDYKIVPQNIAYIIECLLDCEFVYDIVNEIYRQLLKWDEVTSVVY